MLVDLDRFKSVNDQHGYSVGDAVLQATANAFRASLRPDDLIVRLGGDEFAVIIVELPTDAARRVVQRVRQAIATHSEEAGCGVTCTAGFVVSHDRQPLERLFHEAEQALRQGKSGGRDQAVEGSLAP